MINMVALMGRLTFEPELKTTPAGVSVIRFQVACGISNAPARKDRQILSTVLLGDRQQSSSLAIFIRAQ